MMPIESFRSRVRAVIDANHLLKHPFYRAWTEGALRKVRLTISRVAGQYNRPAFRQRVHDQVRQRI